MMRIASFALAVVAVAGQNGVADSKGRAYATAPWDATFAVGQLGSGPKQANFTVRVHPEWAPEGAKRFQDIVQDGIFADARFFRVVPNFMVQWGIPGSPKVAASWRSKNIPDDKVTKHNTRGMMTYATSGPNSRTTQMFINFGDNTFLDSQGFAPFAEVLGNGMEVVDRIQNKYQEQPDQGAIQSQGNNYLSQQFPDLSFVTGVTSKELSDAQSHRSLNL